MLKNVFIDFDGVLSACKIYDINGKCVGKAVRDCEWTAIKRMRAAGLNVAIISGDEWNRNIVESRFIKFIHADTLGPSSKLNTLKRLKVNLAQSVYIGDDWYDIELLEAVGFPYCPSDAIVEVKDASDVLESRGGTNCIAELYEDLINQKLVKRVAPNEG